MDNTSKVVFVLCTIVASSQTAILDTPSIQTKDVGVKQFNDITEGGSGLSEIDRFKTNRQQRFFSSVTMNTIDSPNDISTSALEKVDDPNAALSGVYSDCLINLSFPCLQRKILVFLDRLGRMARFDLIGNFLSVVRTAKNAEPPLTEDTLLARKIDDDLTLKTMIDSSIDRFFDEHIFRVILPDVGDTGRSTSVIDFRVGDYFSYEEGRGKKKKGGKMKGMKKMMMMGCMMMMGKAAMFGPMIMGIASLAAIKALVLSTIALTISKIIILKKLKMMMNKGGSSGWPSSGGGGGGGGSGWTSGGGGSSSGGWSSSGGGSGGWSSGGGSDRSYDAHSLAYNAYR